MNTTKCESLLTIGPQLTEDELRKLRALIEKDATQAEDDDDDEGEDSEEEEEEEPIKLLPSDGYSFFAVSSWKRNRRSFLCGCLTAALQFTVLGLLLEDTWDLRVTPEGDLVVFRAAQIVAVFITAYTQDELLTSLDSIQFGSYYYHHHTRGALKKIGLETSDWSWNFSILIRFVQGLFSLWVSFILVLSQDTVRDIVLNVTAIGSISAINEQLFSLAKRRYFGRDVAKIANKIDSAAITLACPQLLAEQRKATWLRCSMGRSYFVFFLFVVQMVLYIITPVWVPS